MPSVETLLCGLVAAATENAGNWEISIVPVPDGPSYIEAMNLPIGMSVLVSADTVSVGDVEVIGAESEIIAAAIYDMVTAILKKQTADRFALYKKSAPKGTDSPEKVVRLTPKDRSN